MTFLMLEVIISDFLGTDHDLLKFIHILEDTTEISKFIFIAYY